MDCHPKNVARLTAFFYFQGRPVRPVPKQPDTATGTPGAVNGLWAIVWLLLLLIFGWWLGFLCALLYVVVIPFTICCPTLLVVTNIFLSGEKLPYIMTKHIIKCTPLPLEDDGPAEVYTVPTSKSDRSKSYEHPASVRSHRSKSHELSGSTSVRSKIG